MEKGYTQGLILNWINALRSGKYKENRRDIYLRNIHNEFSTLGVFLDCFDNTRWTKEDLYYKYNDTLYNKYLNFQFLPYSHLSKKDFCGIISAKDLFFIDIANYIEEFIEKVLIHGQKH